METTNNIEKSFVVRCYRITWKSANPNYGHEFNLVPTITLFETENGDIERGAYAFLFFRTKGQVRGASFDGGHIYALDLPLVSATDVIHLIESGQQLKFTYKKQADREWAELDTELLPL
jgi:hypothetical protein